MHRFRNAETTTPAKNMPLKLSIRLRDTIDREFFVKLKFSITVRDTEMLFNWLSSSKRRISMSSIL